MEKGSKQMENKMKIEIFLLAFVAGLLIGEYRGCPKDKYSFEWGCER